VKILLSKLHNTSANLLLTPTLRQIKNNFPSSEIWMLTRAGSETILDGCLDIDELRLIQQDEKGKILGISEWFASIALLQELRQQHFDVVFDLSENSASHWLCALSGAKQIVSSSLSMDQNVWLRSFFHKDSISHSEWGTKHSVERDFLLVNEHVKLGHKLPNLTFDKSCYQYWSEPLLEHRFIVFHPNSDLESSMWTVDRWIALGKYLIRRDYAVIVSSGQDQKSHDLAKRITHELGKGAVATPMALTWGQWAGLLHQADTLITVDSTLVYLSAACQCSVIALYGQTSVSLCHPWQVEYQLIFPDNRYSDFDPLTQSVKHIQLHQVQEACQALF